MFVYVLYRYYFKRHSDTGVHLIEDYCNSMIAFLANRNYLSEKCACGVGIKYYARKLIWIYSNLPVISQLAYDFCLY